MLVANPANHKEVINTLPSLESARARLDGVAVEFWLAYSALLLSYPQFTTDTKKLQVCLLYQRQFEGGINADEELILDLGSRDRTDGELGAEFVVAPVKWSEAESLSNMPGIEVVPIAWKLERTELSSEIRSGDAPTAATSSSKTLSTSTRGNPIEFAVITATSDDHGAYHAIIQDPQLSEFLENFHDVLTEYSCQDVFGIKIMLPSRPFNPTHPEISLPKSRELVLRYNDDGSPASAPNSVLQAAGSSSASGTFVNPLYNSGFFSSPSSGTPKTLPLNTKSTLERSLDSLENRSHGGHLMKYQNPRQLINDTIQFTEEAPSYVFKFFDPVQKESKRKTCMMDLLILKDFEPQVVHPQRWSINLAFSMGYLDLGTGILQEGETTLSFLLINSQMELLVPEGVCVKVNVGGKLAKLVDDRRTTPDESDVVIIIRGYLVFSTLYLKSSRLPDDEQHLLANDGIGRDAVYGVDNTELSAAVVTVFMTQYEKRPNFSEFPRKYRIQSFWGNVFLDVSHVPFGEGISLLLIDANASTFELIVPVSVNIIIETSYMVGTVKDERNHANPSDSPTTLIIQGSLRFSFLCIRSFLHAQHMAQLTPPIAPQSVMSPGPLHSGEYGVSPRLGTSPHTMFMQQQTALQAQQQAFQQSQQINQTHQQAYLNQLQPQAHHQRAQLQQQQRQLQQQQTQQQQHQAIFGHTSDSMTTMRGPPSTSSNNSSNSDLRKGFSIQIK